MATLGCGLWMGTVAVVQSVSLFFRLIKTKGFREL